MLFTRVTETLSYYIKHTKAYGLLA